MYEKQVHKFLLESHLCINVPMRVCMCVHVCTCGYMHMRINAYFYSGNSDAKFLNIYEMIYHRLHLKNVKNANLLALPFLG